MEKRYPVQRAQPPPDGFQESRSTRSGWLQIKIREDEHLALTKLVSAAHKAPIALIACCTVGLLAFTFAGALVLEIHRISDPVTTADLTRVSSLSGLLVATVGALNWMVKKFLKT